jgi:hypothetical protein
MFLCFQNHRVCWKLSVLISIQFLRAQMTRGKKPKSHYVMLHLYQLDALHNTNSRVIKRWTYKVKLCNKINTDTKKSAIFEPKKILSRALFYESFGQTNIFFFMALPITYMQIRYWLYFLDTTHGTLSL